jgi:hypothetical protein
MVCSPVSQGSYAELPRLHGAEALPPIQPLSGRPGGRVTPHYGMFPDQSKFWSKKPPLADERELVTTGLVVKNMAHNRSAARSRPRSIAYALNVAAALGGEATAIALEMPG